MFIEYKRCINHTEPGAPSPSAAHAKSDVKPRTATIIGAAVGSLAGLAALLALVWAIYRHIKNSNQVDDSGTSSDITPIVPGIFDGEAPNSVPPAGTG